jgi:hypothetical protein
MVSASMPRCNRGSAARGRGERVDGTLVAPPRRATATDGLAEIPAALRDYAVETPDLRRYDALLEAARCPA